LTALAIAAAVACDDSTSPNTPGGQRPEGMTVVPSSARIQAGQSVLLKATLRDEFGDALAATFEWRSSDDAVATVARNGEVFGRSQGYAIITASSLGKSQTSTVRVVPRPGKPQGKPGSGPDPMAARH
ncbi:MAG TPA: Ig-like domain-containing protein, partial [Gemmatimonadales bacterium]